MCSPHGGYLRGARCPFCYAEAVMKALERFSQVYWKISGGNQLAGCLERWMSLIPLLLFLLWKLVDLGAGAMVHFPILPLTHKQTCPCLLLLGSPSVSGDIYSAVSTAPERKLPLSCGAHVRESGQAGRWWLFEINLQAEAHSAVRCRSEETNCYQDHDQQFLQCLQNLQSSFWEGAELPNALRSCSWVP